MEPRATAPVQADLLVPSLGDWQWLAHASRPNGLVVGPEALVMRILGSNGTWMRPPVVHWPRGGAPWRCRQPLSTLVLHEVGTLSREDQSALLQWMGGAGSGVQILSLTSSSLFPLVQRGHFSETLYYRLNCVVIECASSSLVTAEAIGHP